MTLPLVVIAALFLTRASGPGSGPSTAPSSAAALPPVSVPAPPATDDRTVATCANVISALPLVLGGQNLRRTVSTPSSASIVAWGEPAIVLRCGVARPPTLRVNSGDFLVTANGVVLLPAEQHGGTVFTVVDRAVYLDVSVPSSYPQPPLGPLATAIAKVLPAVCEAQPLTGPLPPASRLCTHRR